MSMDQETELLKQLMAGDARAFREIYERYQGKLFLFAYRFTKSKSEAEEIVQQVFIKLWERREKIHIERSLSSYMLKSIKNLILDGLRHAARDHKMQQRIQQQMLALQNSESEAILQKELERLHRQAIDSLTPQRKKVYLLSREEELSYAQIAEKLGVSVNTVRNQVSEALQSIREYISNHPDLACLTLAMVFQAMKD